MVLREKRGKRDDVVGMVMMVMMVCQGTLERTVAVDQTVSLRLL